MTLQWRVLGFDVREDEEECRKAPLPQNVREDLLLRPEIVAPFSVDSHIWTSYFLFSPYMHMIGPGSHALIPAEPGLGLWRDLESMRIQLSANKRTGIQIAVELLAQENINENDFPSSLIFSKAEPNAVPQGSVLLGYDVADAGFWSGLSNCGYTKDELERLRPEWSKRINDFGMLRSEHDALAFKEISDRRVPEHAPFWIYRLHRLPDEESPAS